MHQPGPVLLNQQGRGIIARSARPLHPRNRMPWGVPWVAELRIAVPRHYVNHVTVSLCLISIHSWHRVLGAAEGHWRTSRTYLGRMLCGIPSTLNASHYWEGIKNTKLSGFRGDSGDTIQPRLSRTRACHAAI